MLEDRNADPRLVQHFLFRCHIPLRPSLPCTIRVDSTPGVAQYLYDTTDVWRFTLLWTLILFEACHLLTALYATAIQLRNRKTVTWWWPWIIPLVSLLIGGIEALLAGTIVGYV